MMSRAGKEVVYPAAPAEEKKDRFQVHLRHKGKRIHFGSYHNKDAEKFARDFSEFLKSQCHKGISFDGRYHHFCSLEIFQEFERLPRKLLVPIYMKLPIYDKKDPILVKAFAAFASDARDRIHEMLPCLNQRLKKNGLLNSATSNGVQNIQWGLSEGFELEPLVIGTECCMIGSSSFTPVSEMKKFVNDHFNDWVILAELVHIYGTEHIMSIIFSRFSEGSFLKDLPGDPRHQTSVLQEGNFGEHNTTWEGFSGRGTNTDGDHSDQFQINQSTATVFDSNLHSGFQTSVLQEGNFGYPGFDHDDHNTMWEGFSGPGTNTNGDHSDQFQNDQFPATVFDSNLHSGFQTSVLQEGNFGYPGFGHHDHDTMWEGFSGPGTNTNGDRSDQFQNDQSSATAFDLHWDLQFANLEACKINPLVWQPIIREDVPKLMSLSEAKRYLDERFSDYHWVILAENVRISWTDTLSLLIERLSSEQEYKGGFHDEISDPFQEGNFGYASFNQYQNNAACGGLAGLSSNITGGCIEQVYIDQSSVFVCESSFQSASLEPCGTSPLALRFGEVT